MSSFKYSIEIVPPRSLSEIDELINTLMPLKPEWVNVTNHRDFNGAMRTSIYLKERFHLRPVMHLRVGDPVQGILAKLSGAGIGDLFLIRGEEEKGRAHASELVAQVRSSPIGTAFRIGVAGFPEKHVDAVDPETDLLFLKEKVLCGADYVLAQICFNNIAFAEWGRRCREAGITVPLLPGLIPLTENLVSLVEGRFNVQIPPLLRKSVSQSGDAGLEWMFRQIDDLHSRGHDHVHLFLMNDVARAERIVRRLTVK